MKFIHRWIYGENIHESDHMYHDRKDGLLSIIEQKINHHGDDARGGTEMGWGVKEKIFPKDILDAPITHMSAVNAYEGGHTIYVDIEMHEMTVAAILEQEEEDE